ncbi:MAG: Flp family type IVb pilin [Moraxellaceae bacterium]|nr:MAG: Flp family type IVb pilin [Moraxellaceae bacterium]
MESIKQFLIEEDGLTTVEYAVAGSLVAAAVAGAFSLLGDAVGGAIATLTSWVDGSGGAAAGP